MERRRIFDIMLLGERVLSAEEVYRFCLKAEAEPHPLARTIMADLGAALAA